MIENLAFPQSAGADPMAVEINGSVGFDGRVVGVHAHMEQDAFLLETAAELELGGGIVLAPTSADEPVLIARYDTATGELDGLVAGRLLLTDLGAEVILTGSLALSVNAGSVVVEDIDLASSVIADLSLAGGVRLREAELSVSYDGGGAALGIAGALRVPGANGGEAGVTVAGRIEVAMVAGQPRITAAQADSALMGALSLPGNVQLADAGAHLRYAGTAFTASLGGSLRLGAGMSVTDGSGTVRLQADLAYDLADPQRIHLATTVDAVGFRLGEHAEIFNAHLRLTADNGPGGTQPAGLVTLTGAGAGLFARSTTASTPADYRLAVSDLAASFSFSPSGFELGLSEGTLRLPPELFAADAGDAPSVSLAGADASEALRLVFDDGNATLDINGRLVFRDFGLALAGGGPSVHLSRAELLLAGAQLPTVVDLDGEARLPLPGGKTLIVGLEELTLAIDGPPSGRIFLAGDIEAIEIGGGFALGILATDPDGQGRAPGLEFIPAGSQLRFLLEGGLRFTAPADLVSAEDGGAPATVSIEGYGSLEFATDPAFTPRFEVDALALRAQNLRFGGDNGLHVLQAEATVDGINALIDPASAEVLTLDFSGTVEAVAGPDTLMLSLSSARFSFPDGTMPTFAFGGIGIGSSTPLLGGLVRVTELGIEFEEPDRALLPPPSDPALLAPDNIALTLSGELAIDSGSGVLIGGVERSRFSLDDQGRPVIRLDGFSVGIEGLDVGIMSLTGALAVRGLDGQQPPRLVGKLGGQYTGTGLEFLCALGLPDPPAPPLIQPLGACLDVSLGSAGIPLGYGFVLSGASGGISFQNSNASPCDFKAYLGLDDDGNAVPPTTPAAPDADGGGATIASARPTPHGDCPAPCPPAAMNPLCQPHPDAVTHPNRAILRFSSLDQALLESLGVRAFVEQHFPDLPSFDATLLADQLRDALAALLPAPSVPVNVPDPALQAILDDPLGFLAEQLANAVDAAIAAADASAPTPPTPWELVRDIAYAGIPCPDVTLQVTGSFSYTGVSAFASVTGGVTVSSTGTIGVLGSLNVLSIPIGQLRAFLTLTDAAGNPDPSLCGDLQLGVGPLEVGQVGFTEYFMGDVGALPELLSQAAAAAGLPAQIVIEELQAALPDIAPAAGADPWPVVQSLDLDQCTLLASRLSARLAANAPDAAAIGSFLTELLALALNAYDPRAVMCGQVAPKLFGLPLMGGELAAFRGWASVRDMGGMLAFSPSYLIGRVVPGADFFAGMDRASLGFAMAFPDPAAILIDGLRGDFASPEALERYLDAGIERLLAEARFTFSFELAPFGLSLTRTAGRVLMPYLTPHPADPDTPVAERWSNPDDDAALPDRMQVLAAAVKGDVPGGRLADILWDGRLNELEIPGFGWPADERLLGRDYFPHGGLVGAGYLQLPRALAEAPPMALLGAIVDPQAAPLERLTKLMEYVEGYLTQMVELGSLSLYLPAPEPPALTINGEPVGPRRILRDLATLDLGGVPLAGLPGYPAELSFLRGELDLVLLGVPIADALIEAVPPAGPAASGRLEVRASIPVGSWLSALVDSAELRFEFIQPPGLPLQARFEALAAALFGDSQSAVGDALELLVGALESADARLAETSLSSLDPNDDGPAEARQVLTDALREGRAAGLETLRDESLALAPLWRAARSLAESDPTAAAAAVSDVLSPILADIRDSLPKVALHAEVNGLHLPPPLGDWLSLGAGSLSLSAFSPWFDPHADGDDAMAIAQREGGIVVQADLELRIGQSPGLSLGLPALTLALTPSAGSPDSLATRLVEAPVIRCRRSLGPLLLPGTPLALESAELIIDSAPPADGDFLRIRGALAPIAIGKLELASTDGGPLRGEFRARPVPGQALGAIEVRVDACLIQLPLLTASTRLRLHGADGPDTPATLATEGPWSAALSVESLALESPYDPDDPALFAIDPAAQPQVLLEGEGLGSATLVLSLPAGAVTLFPEVPALRRTVASGFELRAASDGDIEGRLELAPIELGVLRLHGGGGPNRNISVRMRPYGLGLPHGFRVSIMGLTSTRIRLRSCVVDGFGHFSVSSTRRTLPVEPWFKFSSSSLRAWNGENGAGLSLREARLKLLPGTPLAKMPYLLLGVDQLDIASDGSFAVALDGALIKAPGLPELSGRLEVRNEPLPGAVLNPSVQLIGGRIRAPWLPELDGDIRIAPEAISATLSVGTITLGGAIEIEAGSWTLAWRPGDALVLTVAQLGATVGGRSMSLDGLRISLSGEALSFSASCTLFGSVAATLSASIAANGQFSASLSGPFDLSAISADPQFAFAAVDFGWLSLPYDPARPATPFRIDLPGIAIIFGGAGARVCVVGVDATGNEVLGPCFPPP